MLEFLKARIYGSLTEAIRNDDVGTVLYLLRKL